MTGSRRYQPQRPLPQQPYLPGRGGLRPAPAAAPIGRASSTLAPRCSGDDWRDCAAYLWGVDLYNAGFFWEAHEAWEEVFRIAEQGSSPRVLVQGLIQCAASCLKLRLGDLQSARRLATRGLGRIEGLQSHCGPRYMGIDLPRFAQDFRSFIAGGSGDQRWPLIVLELGAPRSAGGG
jgi:uncharacterized protein